MYLIIPFEIRECQKCGTYNLIGYVKCCECGADMREVDG